jgi:hypothetical protein
MKSCITVQCLLILNRLITFTELNCQMICCPIKDDVKTEKLCSLYFNPYISGCTMPKVNGC